MNGSSQKKMLLSSVGLIFLVGLFLCVSVSNSAGQPRVRRYYFEGNVDSSGVTKAIGFFGCPLVVNDGSADLHVEFNGETATNSSPRIKPTEFHGECSTSTDTVSLKADSTTVAVRLFVYSSQF